MPTLLFIFLGLCAFLLGFWLVRYFERRRLGSSTSALPLPSATSRNPVGRSAATKQSGSDRLSLALEQDVQQLLAENRKLEAIKRVRIATGWSLKRTKDYIDQRSSRPSPNAVPKDIGQAAQQLVAENQKIAAIKLVRTHTGWDLKTAKAYVESL